MTHAGLKGRCFLELKSVLLEVSYIEKWPKFAYFESKVPHLKFQVMRDRVYITFLKYLFGHNNTGSCQCRKGSNINKICSVCYNCLYLLYNCLNTKSITKDSFTTLIQYTKIAQ